MPIANKSSSAVSVSVSRDSQCVIPVVSHRVVWLRLSHSFQVGTQNLTYARRAPAQEQSVAQHLGRASCVCSTSPEPTLGCFDAERFLRPWRGLGVLNWASSEWHAVRARRLLPSASDGVESAVLMSGLFARAGVPAEFWSGGATTQGTHQIQAGTRGE